MHSFTLWSHVDRALIELFPARKTNGRLSFNIHSNNGAAPFYELFHYQDHCGSACLPFFSNYSIHALSRPVGGDSSPP